MIAYKFCEVCGNELDRMGAHALGCVSCYVASGPDWTERWLKDAAAATVKFSSIVSSAHRHKDRWNDLGIASDSVSYHAEPDWPKRLLEDAAVATRIFNNVISFNYFRERSASDPDAAS